MPRSTDAAKQQDYSSFFSKLILAKFDSMPEWVRVFTFLVALIVLVYIAWHSVNARYFVTGTVLEPSPNHPGSNQLARGYDVRWGENYAGTNSKGHYVFVLSPIEYFSLVSSGNHALQIWKPGDKNDIEDLQVCNRPIQFQRMESAFDDYYINAQCQSGQPLPTRAAVRPIAPFTLLPVVHAAAQAPGNAYHLLTHTVHYDSHWPRSDSAQMLLFQNGAELPLLNYSGDPYGGISILPGSSFAFSDGTYIGTPILGGGSIRIANKTGMFTYTEEWFPLPAHLVLGKEVIIRGSLGSDLSLVPIGRSTLTVYRKAGDENYFQQLGQDLLKAGVFPVGATAPLGANTATNTLFVGADVPPSTIRAVVTAVVKSGVQLKRIDYPYTFKSTPDTSRIQLGYAGTCVNAPAIKPAILAQLASLPDDQVQTFLQPFNQCHTH